MLACTSAVGLWTEALLVPEVLCGAALSTVHHVGQVHAGFVGFLGGLWFIMQLRLT